MASRDFNAAIDRINFAKSVNRLSPYFQVSTPQDLSATVALQELQGFSNSIPNEALRPSEEVTRLIDLVINTSEGSLTTKELVSNLGTTLQGANNQNPVATSGNVGERFRNLIQIHYAGSTSDRSRYPFLYPTVNQMIGLEQGQAQRINGNPNSPSKDYPGLSAIVINTTQAMPQQKNVGAITLFLNGVPDIELRRAVPFINLEILSARDPMDADGNIQGLGFIKFLRGAVNAGTGGNDNVTNLLLNANTVSGSIGENSGRNGFLSTAGLEMFTSPQTMVNANESTTNTGLRATPVIDKFRPFMSLKSLNIDIISAGAGMISYKTAKLEFVLHDSSRMAEIADFIKPDLYGNTELVLEYGWSHPDIDLDKNPYGTLINGMRSKEKYGIRNVSIALDQSRQANVTLDLFMKGGTDFDTTTISAGEHGVNNIVAEIERLARVVNTYEQRLFRNNSPRGGTTTGRTAEIRGSQILEAAADYQNQVRLTPDILRSLGEFERTLNNSRAINTNVAGQLTTALRSLYRQRTSTNAADGGTFEQLSVSLQENVERKINRVLGRGSIDALLPPDTTIGSTAFRYLSRRAVRAGTPNGTRDRNSVVALREPRVAESFISLGKLLLLFVGEPLAMTKKYDDVQFLFYPFNKYAGFANTLNISQFVVDTRYFVQQYVRFRTENLSRAANLSLKDFLGFIANKVIDDPGATLYGIHDLYEEVQNRQTNDTTVQPRGNAVEFQTRLEQRLRSRTPDATFKMPQIEFYLETIPGKTITDNGNSVPSNKSILRIHVFDRQATSYETQSSIIRAARENTLNSIGSLPLSVNDGEPGIRESHEATARAIIDLARQEQLITPITNGGIQNGSGRNYRINGGPQAIKDFLLKTMPYITYGVMGTGVKQAGVNSMQNAALATVNMQRSYRVGPLEANGEAPGGLPMSVIPFEISTTTFGCPLIDFAQQFFIDFKTGTTLDNIYGAASISHKIEQGSFESEMKWVPIDAYGAYSSMIDKINQAADYLQNISDQSAAPRR